jgi:class 3 adenylate cyclase
MVVLALLTLFQIVGLTFTSYAQTHNSADENLRDAAAALAARARDAAPVVREDLLDALAGDLELPQSRAELERLREAAVAFLDVVTRARDAVQDESERKRVERLWERANEVVESIDRLRCYIHQIELGVDRPPR